MNKILLSIFLAVFLVQFIKGIIYWIREGFDFKEFFDTGGMPSSHSAFVMSLVTIIYLTEGTSSIFVVALVLALIVMTDAFRVRRTVGEEADLIKLLLKKTKLKVRKKFHESEGHTIPQVVVGALLGIGISLLVFFL
jgi:uncharacterized protein